MIIVDPVILGDAPCVRGSTATYWDRDGALQTAAENELRATYDPNDLSAAPYALVERLPATNVIRNSTMQGAVVGTPGAIPTNWSLDKSAGQNLSVVAVGQENNIDYIDVRFWSTSNDRAYIALYPERTDGLNVPASPGEKWVSSMFMKHIAGDAPADLWLTLRSMDGNGVSVNDKTVGPLVLAPASTRLSAARRSVEVEATPALTARLTTFFIAFVPVGKAFDFTLRIGLPQLQRDRMDSPIKTTNTALTRAADVVSTAAGLVQSNVPEPEPLYNPATAYAAQARVRMANHDLYESLIANNQGNDPTLVANANKWLKLGKTNRWAQFDEQNNTQTSNAEEILFVLSPKAISQGLFLGNLDATEIRVSMTDLTRGVVYSEVQSLVLPRSGRSFFKWCFNRIRRKTYFLTLKLPVFAKALVTVSIRKPGGIAKCGMCMIGPAIDIGLSHYGLSTEIKDFSSTTFKADGTSDTVPRGYAKRMSVDVSVSNDVVESVNDQLIAFRQKVVVYVGAAMYGSAILVGKFSSFKKVIESHPFSKMALQIEGVV